MNKEILRRALRMAAGPDAFGELVEALGFAAEAHPVDFMGDPAAVIHGRLLPVLDGLWRVGGHGASRSGLWIGRVRADGGGAFRERARRRLAKALVELAPGGDRQTLIVILLPGTDDFELVLPRQRLNAPLATVRALVSRNDPTRHHLELLEDLVLHPDMTPVEVARRWTDAFNVEKITKDFFLEFRRLRNRLVEALREHNPGHPLLDVDEEDTEQYAELRRYATRNLGRLLFLWFIQAKGWLDGDAAYLKNLYERRCRAKGHNFFRETLLPLFFEALACKEGKRTEAAKLLGKVPYLNGGLFLQSDFEDRLYGDGREKINLNLPNEIFDPRLHDEKAPTVLGLFSGYRFTTRESTPDDQSLDPDPELLGKVFENLLEGRKETGTFYTPREVVRFMCREALDGYLMSAAGVSREILQALRLKALDPEATEICLSAAECERLHQALDNVTVCDLAVGSGAFSVGMLQEILQLKIGIEQSADVTVKISGQRVAEWKERIITRSLYGVDLNPEAIEICHLRLWLSLVIDADRPVPLPNLDFRFVAGDSLVDRAGSHPLKESLPRGQEIELFSELAQYEAELKSLREQYAKEKEPGEAKRLRRRIREVQIAAVRHQLKGRISECAESLREIRRKLTKMERMPGGGYGARGLRKELEDLERKQQVFETVLKELHADAPWKKPFLWPVEFPEIFDRGGFDIVVTNPPYVRQEKLAALDQECYEAAFFEVFAGTADLLVFFFARALQILKEGGHLAFITSNKFHRAGYGESLRGWLPAHLQIENVVDFGDLPVFDAIAYPTILTGRKTTGIDKERGLRAAELAPPIYRALRDEHLSPSVASVRDHLQGLDNLVDNHRRSDFSQGLLTGSGWVLEDPRLLRLFNRLRVTGVPLGKFVQGKMYYGIKTGLNEAFVIDEETRKALVKADKKSAELIKSYLRGRDVKRWKAEWVGLHIIAIQNSGDADARNPWSTAKNEKEARMIFAKSYPAVHEHLSAYEEFKDPKNPKKKKGLRHREDQGRYWWELRACTYYREFEGSKTIWATLAPEPRFLFDAEGFFSNQKTYIAPGIPEWTVPLLNSSLFFAIAAGTSLVTKQGGFYEWEKKYMWNLPIVTPPAEIRTRLEALARAAAENPAPYEPEIDALAEELYGVTKAESRLLKQWREEHAYRSASESDADDE